MIISCPNCSTRYTVANTAVPPQGRKVRCKSCGHIWYQRPVDEDDHERTLIMQDVQADLGRYRPPATAAEKPKAPKPRRKGVLAGWLVFVLLLAGLGAGAYYGRAHIVALWPPAALLYETVGLPVESPGAGLQLQNIRSEQRVENGTTTLLVEGQILNTSEAVRTVPKVRAVSLGFDRKPVQVWTIEASSGQLLPGEIATFRSTRPDPGPVAEVMVTFEGG